MKLAISSDGVELVMASKKIKIWVLQFPVKVNFISIECKQILTWYHKQHTKKLYRYQFHHYYINILANHKIYNPFHEISVQRKNISFIMNSEDFCKHKTYIHTNSQTLNIWHISVKI